MGTKRQRLKRNNCKQVLAAAACAAIACGTSLPETTAATPNSQDNQQLLKVSTLTPSIVNTDGQTNITLHVRTTQGPEQWPSSSCRSQCLFEDPESNAVHQTQADLLAGQHEKEYQVVCRAPSWEHATTVDVRAQLTCADYEYTTSTPAIARAGSYAHSPA